MKKTIIALSVLIGTLNADVHVKITDIELVQQHENMDCSRLKREEPKQLKTYSLYQLELSIKLGQ